MRLATASCLVALLLIGTAGAVGQGELVELRVDQLRAPLGLTDEQADQVKGIVAENIGSGQDRRSQGRPDPASELATADELESRARQQIGEVLDDRQREKLAAYHGAIIPDRQLLHLNNALGLSAEQVPVVEGILGIYRAEMRALRLESDSDRREMMSRMRDIQERQDESLKTVLDKEQAKQLDELREQQQEELKQRFEERSKGRGRGDRPGGGGRRPEF